MRLWPKQGLGPFILLTVSLVAAGISNVAGENQRVVCYYTNWSVYRPGTAKFNPQNINPYLCTHLIYAFGGLTKENSLRPFDKYQDIEQGGYAKFNGLKSYNKQLKTLLAIGGWNEGSTRFSPLVADPERRQEFVKNVVRFLRTNHFDGLDLDWEYPAFRDGGKAKDRENYASLVAELRAEFERESSKTGRERLLLTMAVPAGTEYIDKGYDVPSLNKNLDFFNLLSYDYHSAYEPVVNHHAPLFGGGDPDNEYNYEAQLSIDITIKHYIKAGADPSKLVLGIPTYGRSYTLFNPLATEIGSAADGPGEQGDATREKGYLAYYEICESIKKDGWTVESPNPTEVGPYAYKGNQWVGYDDIDIVKTKARYVSAQGLGGIMFWSIDNDDFRGKCHDRPYPLIEAAKEALLESSKPSETPKKSKPSSTGLAPRRPTAPARSGAKRPKPLTTTSTEAPKFSTTPVPPNVELLNTPEPPTTPDPGSDFVCKDEGFFPHPRDCKKYFWCLDSGPSQLGIVAHQFTCPSGLLFNKIADSCDYARNVVCKQSKSTSTTTTTTASPPTSQKSPVYKPSTTSTTTTTTTTTTTAAPEEEEYEYDEEEYDPQAIKDLVALIKKLGGVEQLEKQFGGNKEDSKQVTVAPNIPKALYDRVLGGRNRPQSGSGGSALVDRDSLSRKETPRTSSSNRSRGPQNQGLENLEEVRGLNKEKPKYTEIRKARPRPVADEEEEEVLEEHDETEEQSAPEVSTQRTRRPFNTKYTNISRSRPSTAAPVEEEVEEEPVEKVIKQQQQEEAPKRKLYASLSRSRSTTAAPVPDEVAEEEEVGKTQLEFEGNDEVTKVGFKDGNSLRRQVVDDQVDSATDEQLPPQETTTTELSQETATPTEEPSTSSPSGFLLTKPVSTTTTSERPRVFVVNAQPATEASTTSTTAPPTTLEEVTTEQSTEEPTTPSAFSTNTVTSVVTSITESLITGRTKIIINKKQFVLFPRSTTTMAPTSKEEKSDEEEAPIDLTTTTTTTTTEAPTSKVRGTTIRFKRPPLRQKLEEKSTYRKQLVRKRPLKTEKPTEEPEVAVKEEPVTRRSFVRQHHRFNYSAPSTTEETPEASPVRKVNIFKGNRGRVTFTSSEEVTDEGTPSSERPKFVPRRRGPSALSALSTTENTASSSSEETTSKRPSRRRNYYTTEATAVSSSRRPSRIERRRRPNSSSTTVSTTTAPPATIYSEEFTSETFEPTTALPLFTSEELAPEVSSTPRRKTVVLIRGRPSSTTAQPADLQYDPYYGTNPDEFFLLSSSQTGPDASVEEENFIGALDDEAPVATRPTSSTSRPLSSVNRRPFQGGRSRTRTTAAPATTSSPILETADDYTTKAPRQRFVVRRKFRPTTKDIIESTEGKESQFADAPEATSKSPRRNQNFLRRAKVSSSTTTTTEEPAQSTAAEIGETSALVAEPSPALYYSKQPIDEQVATEEIPSTGTVQDYSDLANAHVTALTQLATAAPPSASAGPTIDHLDADFPDPEAAPAPFVRTSPAPVTSAPRQRSQRPSSAVREQKPFTKINRGNTKSQQHSLAPVAPFTQTVTLRHQEPAVHHPPSTYDYYDTEPDSLQPTYTNKVKIHEDGSLECLDRGNFAHPFSCRKFISCALMENGALLGWIYTCPRHLAFDPIGGICNWSGGCKE